MDQSPSTAKSSSRKSRTLLKGHSCSTDNRGRSQPIAGLEQKMYGLQEGHRLRQNPADRAMNEGMNACSGREQPGGDAKGNLFSKGIPAAPWRSCRCLQPLAELSLHHKGFPSTCWPKYRDMMAFCFQKPHQLKKKPALGAATNGALGLQDCGLPKGPRRPQHRPALPQTPPKPLKGH